MKRERIVWQLDRLKENGVLNAIVSYNHHADGTPNSGEPPVFSAAWWHLIRGVLDDCRERGMKLSFQDYTLLNPVLQEIGAGCPEMSGGELREVHARICGGGHLRLAAEPECPVVCAFAYPLTEGVGFADKGRDLSSVLNGDVLDWDAPEGDWLVSLVFVRPNGFDPMHGESGKRVISRFYAPFEAEIGEHLGTTFPISFQDELDFGSRMPLWSGGLLQEFSLRKAYELGPLLPALWHDLGPITPKVRIDYADVVTTLLEAHYFIPIFEWHQQRGLLFGNDNCGRGGIEAGRAAYGDAFRTMRWYSAPGTDDPNLAGARAFKGLKVNSSIAHLYRRPRVWNECFHSSGWGTTPAEVIAALNEDFIYGATVVNLHGLYYSTYGSWWEWAPPDFHFRQPYWEHTGALTQYVTRLCQVLSQGNHVCDVAMVYPITAIESGLNPRVQIGRDASIPHSEAQAGKGTSTFDAAEADAFGIGRHLIDSGIDFDFIDFQSLERAEIGNGEIQVSGEAFRVLLFPSMRAVRFSSLNAACDLFRSGGVVIAFGCLPVASDRIGAADPVINGIVREIFGPVDPNTFSIWKGDSGGRGIFIPRGYGRVVEAISEQIIRDFDPGQSGLMALHRRLADEDTYYLFNPADQRVETEAFFRASGAAELRNAWTGEIVALPSVPTRGGSRVALRFEPGESKLVVFNQARESSPILNPPPVLPGSETPLPLDGLWDFQLAPTMDNQFGDFRLPAYPGMVSAEARQFRYSESLDCNSVAESLPDYDDSTWQLSTYSFGPRFWKLGPLPPGTDTAQLEAGLSRGDEIDPSRLVNIGGHEFQWTPYEFSLRWGIENDPYLQDWASGPHGLKGVVPDEFIDLKGGDAGGIWFLWTSVQSLKSEERPIVMGSRSRYCAWLNGERVLEQTEELPPGRQSEWNLPHYHCNPRQAKVALKSGNNSLLLKFVQPADQRLRAFAAFDSPIQPPALALRWFANPEFPVFNFRPQSRNQFGWYRFMAPPGASLLTIVSRGAVEAWCGGIEMDRKACILGEDGTSKSCFSVKQPFQGATMVALRVALQPGSFAGDALPEPVRFDCGVGQAPACDWAELGLAAYSGTAWYRRLIVLSPGEATRSWTLDLGRVAATASVHLSGRQVATLLAPPWRVNLAGLLHEGENLLEIRVANTLANHYSIGIPTPYVPEGQTCSGLLGPVILKATSPEMNPA